MTQISSFRASLGVPLSRIAQAIDARLIGDGSVQALGIRQDSRHILPGEIFAARRGQSFDGLRFIHQAVKRGACAILSEADSTLPASPVPMLITNDMRPALARAADLIYGEPTRDLDVIAITGTNGKTTTCSLMRSVLSNAAFRPGMMGTLGVFFDQLAFDPGLNTPEADELTRIAAWMRTSGATHLILELTSHGIAEKRADGVRFQVAAFTNLTHDHLDLHGTMAAYGEAKARLFLDLDPQSCALMVDDAFGAALAERLRTPLLRVSRRPGDRADICPISPVIVDRQGIRCTVSTPSGPVELASPLIGEHNLANLLLALGISACLGLDVTDTARALSQAPPAPGRLDRCDGPEDDIVVVVDYAHSPDALEKALEAMRLLGEGRVTCVFGCGGDRDRQKRGPMGEVAGRMADRVIVTSDNPRSEAPEAIAGAIVEGLQAGRASVVVELSRGRAIDLAVATSSPGDLVLIAGKGHETVQVIGKQAFYFDDREWAREALGRRASSIFLKPSHARRNPII